MYVVKSCSSLPPHGVFDTKEGFKEWKNRWRGNAFKVIDTKNCHSLEGKQVINLSDSKKERWKIMVDGAVYSLHEFYERFWC